MKLSSIQFCWWQSRWDFPTFFRLTLKTSRCPFYYSSKCSLLEICLGKCELESCSIKSRSEGLTAYISEHISQSQVLPEVDRSHLRCHLQPPRLPTQLELLPHRLWGGVLWRWGGWLRLQCGGGVQRSLISKFCLNYVIALLSRLKSLSMGRSGVVWQEGQSSCKFQSLP